jgi:hypothetical protein
MLVTRKQQSMPATRVNRWFHRAIGQVKRVI